ncbi:MAG: hypothetical protein IT574_01145 [Candidatus Aureabacteria bacterium]|nr:hypothetical protein [Candidatus Auribacterota bacterium]NLW93212.1 hypothetical protein [Chlamydiota bacterium]HOE26576.1 hypothetical protein [bacterium]HQM52009.1 hypothetical protein [bacterium]
MTEHLVGNILDERSAGFSINGDCVDKQVRAKQMKWFRQRSEQPSRFDPPGPSPWYLRGRKIETSAGILTWADFGNHPVLAGVSRLQTRESADVMLLDFGCYFSPLESGLILLWYEHARNDDDPTTNPFIHFDIIDPSGLTPIEDASSEADRMRKGKQHRVFAPPAIADFTCFTALPSGRHNLADLPPAFATIEETLVLADYCPNGKPSNYFDQMCRAIFAFDFRGGRVEVIPQDWFNDGKYDFGYQWITRVARDPDTGRILGDGIRLGFFRLDETARHVDEWLTSDPFYGPRG